MMDFLENDQQNSSSEEERGSLLPPPEQLITPGQFALLSLVTGGIYLYWWQYKMWRFLKNYHGLPVNPLARAVVNSFFPIYVVSLFVHFAGRAQQRGFTLDFSPLLFSFAYLAIFFANLLFPAYSIFLLFLFVPCLPLVRVHHFLALDCGAVEEHTPRIHKSDLVVVAVSIVVNFATAWWVAHGGAAILGLQ